MIYLIAAIVSWMYAWLVFRLLIGWNKVPVLAEVDDQKPFVSILIPVRNEADHIPRLLSSIFKSHASTADYEVIVIDDHSDDDTLAVVKPWQAAHPSLRVLRLSDQATGKKAAIACGVRQSQGALVLCTDGDSVVGPDWIDQHSIAFQRGSQLSFGPVTLCNAKGSRWIDLLNLELHALVAMGAATLQLGKPTMINGCNYSFAKSAFEAVEGFKGNEDIPSGDDEFLLRKIYGHYPGKIFFLKTKKAIVNTEPPKHVFELIQQRRRWASKWKHHREPYSKGLPVFLFLAYLIWVGVAVLSIVECNYFGWMLLVLKISMDYMYIRASRGYLDEKFSLINFIGLQIIYPIYVVFFGLASNFGTYSWRKRTYKI